MINLRKYEFLRILRKIMLDSRKEHILDFIVRDYIRTALPVSSGRISAKKALEASPATIRGVMLELDEEGYLYQPHTSAGRAPTDKGYRYFVDNLMEIESPPWEIRRELDSILDFDELSKTLVRHLRLFAGVWVLSEDKVFGHGLSEALREPEFFEQDAAVRFADFVENIHREIKNFSEVNVNANGFGVVSVMFQGRDFGECVIFSAGPQRMNYEKSASVLKYAAGDVKIKNLKINPPAGRAGNKNAKQR